MENTSTYKPMLQPWIQKWLSPLPISSWLRLKRRFKPKRVKTAHLKRYIDDIFSLWTLNREEIMQFIEQANKHHPTIKFTAKISETETTFLDINIYEGERFRSNSVLDVRTHFKPTETFNIRTSLRATHQGSKNVSSKARLWDFSEQTLLKKYLKSKFKVLTHAYGKEVIPRTLFKGLSQKCNLKTGNWHSLKNQRRTNESCLSLHNTAQQCQT